MRMLMSRRRVLQMAMVAGVPRAGGSRRAGSRSRPRRGSIPGADGRLVYVPDDQGNAIHDASHAGYRGGGVAIPTVPVRETVWPVAGDNTAHVQAAIDRVSARTPDAQRIPRRGAAPGRLLPAGDAAQDSGQRRGSARRGHGRHRHRS